MVQVRLSPLRSIHTSLTCHVLHIQRVNVVFTSPQQHEPRFNTLTYDSTLFILFLLQPRWTTWCHVITTCHLFAADVESRLDAHERALDGATAEAQRLNDVAVRMRARRKALEHETATFREAAPAEQAALDDVRREAEREVKAALASLFEAELQLCVARDAQEGGHAEQRALHERFLRFEDEAAEHLARLDRITDACALNITVLEHARSASTRRACAALSDWKRGPGVRSLRPMPPTYHCTRTPAWSSLILHSRMS